MNSNSDRFHGFKWVFTGVMEFFWPLLRLVAACSIQSSAVCKESVSPIEAFFAHDLPRENVRSHKHMLWLLARTHVHVFVADGSILVMILAWSSLK